MPDEEPHTARSIKRVRSISIIPELFSSINHRDKIMRHQTSYRVKEDHANNDEDFISKEPNASWYRNLNVNTKVSTRYNGKEHYN